MAARGKGRRFAPGVMLAGVVGVVVACSDELASGRRAGCSDAPDGSAACLGGPNGACYSNGSCPNRVPPSPSDVSLCLSALRDSKCGAEFQVYLNCALREEKCTPEGVTDDEATGTAIATNCSAAVAAYRACGGVISMGTTCGLGGLPCCTDGSPPCASTGCCDPTTNECRGQGEACTAASTVCSSNQCSSCGAPGQPCCQVYGTTQPNPCPSGGCCNYAYGQMGGACIAEGGQCEAPGPNTTETVCRSGSCITCGSELGYCCAANKCDDPGNVCSGGTCRP
jgi:hypothetical protein